MLKKELNIKSTKNNYDIACLLYLPEGKEIKKIIIACHGFGSDKESSTITLLADSLTKCNIGVIALDFPGHGKSKVDGHKFTVRNCIDDINDVEKYVENEFNNIETGFFASSYGAYIILLKINESKKKYRPVVLRCPAINMRSVFENSILNMPLDKFLYNGECIVGFGRPLIVTTHYYNELVENDIFKVYAKENDILLIHGTKDDTAPISESIKFYNKFKKFVKLHKVEGANHRFKNPGETEEVVDTAIKYILER